ncbi:MAG: bifunctional 5,10-methylenetetrahydrofolate dehydrogenase/5,10-methenyltetrahydrofolate cyclohydrolase [Planctomycetes bacterium]|nr:bifunctional 5,10-methylenetetrahydrofolate dehydrogenase/5,10-methenyltetrahydrofolate cyclohydrolase [Planctomycetota bacterium]
MTAQIIDGDAIAAKIVDSLKERVEELKADGKEPHLTAVQVGENPASKIYVRNQKRSCEEVGIKYTLDELPDDTDQNGLAGRIKELNCDPTVSGIILQMPLPKGVDARRIQSIISPLKDVEGMNPANMGRLVYGEAKPGPCTAVGAVELLKSTGVEIEGANAVVVGHSEIVGKPIGLLLLGLNATVSTVHIFTKDVASYVKNADILFVAAGKAQAMWMRYRGESKKNTETPLPDLSALIPADMIKPGAVVIDVAINRIPKGFDSDGQPLLNKKGKTAMQTVGDVDFEAAKEVAGHISPVPGGVGPMTVAMLLKNTVDTAREQRA